MARIDEYCYKEFTNDCFYDLYQDKARIFLIRDERRRFAIWPVNRCFRDPRLKRFQDSLWKDQYREWFDANGNRRYKTYGDLTEQEIYDIHEYDSVKAFKRTQALGFNVVFTTPDLGPYGYSYAKKAGLKNNELVVLLVCNIDLVYLIDFIISATKTGALYGFHIDEPFKQDPCNEKLSIAERNALYRNPMYDHFISESDFYSKTRYELIALILHHYDQVLITDTYGTGNPRIGITTMPGSSDYFDIADYITYDGYEEGLGGIISDDQRSLWDAYKITFGSKALGPWLKLDRDDYESRDEYLSTALDKFSTVWLWADGIVDRVKRLVMNVWFSRDDPNQLAFLYNKLDIYNSGLFSDGTLLQKITDHFNNVPVPKDKVIDVYDRFIYYYSGMAETDWFHEILCPYYWSLLEAYSEAGARTKWLIAVPRQEYLKTVYCKYSDCNICAGTFPNDPSYWQDTPLQMCAIGPPPTGELDIIRRIQTGGLAEDSGDANVLFDEVLIENEQPGILTSTFFMKGDIRSEYMHSKTIYLSR